MNEYSPDTSEFQKSRAARNRTVFLLPHEVEHFRKQVVNLESLLGNGLPLNISDLYDKTICGNVFELLPLLPDACCDLVFADPPYNLSKNFASLQFKEMSGAEYVNWLRLWLPEMRRLLKPTGSIYVCGDWRSSSAIQTVLEDSEFIIQNRITWEREKGRGAKRNWKNNSEDIWFATVSDDFNFHVDRVKLRRKVIAPYRDSHGKAKDWSQTESGNFRLTHPSNLWTDISVPFWSMPENTDHPTQKPEKLVAKIILASTEEGGTIFDPFLGSGTTAVVSRKLGRRFFGVEINEEYCLITEKRLALAEKDKSIQGYSNGVFWERNTLKEQK
ncbi:MAG: DNA methyltransferase [Thermoguttaceae bacterium]